HRMPGAARNLPAGRTAAYSLFGWCFGFATAPAASRKAVTRSTIGAAVLLVAVDEVGNLVVHCDVVHLSDRKLDAVPGAAAIHRNAEAAVIGHRQPVAVSRIDP